MADPAWTAQYNFANTPEQNGFTRQSFGAPTVTLNTGGQPASRNVTISEPTAADSLVCLTSQVPSLSSAVGATAQMVVAVTGGGDAGVELSFLDMDVQVMVLANSILVSLAQDGGDNLLTTIQTPSNAAATTVRVTVDGSKNLRVYRNTVLVSGPTPLPKLTNTFQKVLWWGESGGTQVFTQMAYYLGGAVAP